MSLQTSPRSRALSASVKSGSELTVAPIPALSDEELVCRALSGSSWAEETIYRRYAALLLGTARRLLADSEEARDVVQETFSVAFASWPQLRDASLLRQWLLQIAVSKVHRRFRRKKMLRILGFETGVDDATLDALALPGSSPEVHAELALVARALDRVSVACRVAWMLRYVEGLTLGEVALECRCSLATAKRRIASAEGRVDAFVARSRV